MPTMGYYGPVVKQTNATTSRMEDEALKSVDLALFESLYSHLHGARIFFGLV